MCFLLFLSWPPTHSATPKDFLNKGARVTVFALKTKVHIDIAVEQLASQLDNLNVKTVIVVDKRFPADRVVEALKKSRIADRVRLEF